MPGPAPIAAALTVALAYVIVDIFVQGPLTQLDIWVNRLGRPDGDPGPGRGGHVVYDKMGQRSVLVPILLAVAGSFAWRHRTWRPVVLAAISFLILNVVVGAMKVLIGRSRDRDRRPVECSAAASSSRPGTRRTWCSPAALIVYLLLRYANDPPVRLVAAAWSRR